jgi:hypothetical protein
MEVGRETVAFRIVRDSGDAVKSQRFGFFGKAFLRASTIQASEACEEWGDTRKKEPRHSHNCTKTVKLFLPPLGKGKKIGFDKIKKRKLKVSSPHFPGHQFFALNRS